MKAAENTLLLLLVYSCFFIAKSSSSHCPFSSCGVIPNISHPFRLKTDPTYCGYREAEFACDNNVTIFYLNSHKFYVKSINYTTTTGDTIVRPTIRLVDASININTCSFPTVYAYYPNFSRISSASPYDTYRIPVPINLMSCPQPLNTSIFPYFTDASHCQSSDSRFRYVRIGGMKASEVPETCRVDLIVLTSMEFSNSFTSASLDEIHRALLYGFELQFCTDCYMPWTLWDKIKSFVSGARLLFLIPVAIVVLISAGVSFPAMIVVGLTCGLILFIPSKGMYEFGLSFHREWAYTDYNSCYLFTGTLSSVLSIIMICAPRFFICPLIAWFLINKFRRRHMSMFEAIESLLQSNNNLMPIRYKYSEIHKITKGFQDKLGEGGYGSVYKGKLRSGYHVAVKLLGKSSANSQDFMNEIATIGRIHHINIVKLVRYCAERSKRALVFDFMPNGSLDKYIFKQEEKNCLDWDTKFKIAIGVARGIEYLHSGCDIQILHFDIKPHNILLDENFVPKISDFGLAKLCSIEKDTVTLTAARGTIGYVAPELVNRSIGRVSYKADVYSFGMLLMEMVGLNRDLKGSNDDSSKYFPHWIYDHFNQGRDIEIGKPEESINGNDGNDNIRNVVRKMTTVALWCIQTCPDDRPSMNKVLEMLESEVECLRIPDYPFQSQHVIVREEVTWSTDDSSSFFHSSDVEIRIKD